MFKDNGENEQLKWSAFEFKQTFVRSTTTWIWILD